MDLSNKFLDLEHVRSVLSGEAALYFALFGSLCLIGNFQNYFFLFFTLGGPCNSYEPRSTVAVVRMHLFAIKKNVAFKQESMV